jgi:hypothetical protein
MLEGGRLPPPAAWMLHRAEQGMLSRACPCRSLLCINDAASRSDSSELSHNTMFKPDMYAGPPNGKCVDTQGAKMGAPTTRCLLLQELK